MDFLKSLLLNRRPSVYFLILVFVFTAAAFLRFNNINKRSLFYSDEGVYLLEARFLGEGFNLLAKNNDHLLIKNGFDIQSLKDKTTGIPLIMGKPGFIFVIFIFGLIFGFGDLALFFTSAIFGLINIFLIFKISEKMYNKEIALLSSAIAAVSAYHVFYSTVGLPEMVGLTFYLASFYYFYLSLLKNNNLKYIFLSGILLGYAFTCNQWRWLILPCLFIIFSIFTMFKRGSSFTAVISRASVFVVSFILPVFLFELPYRILWLLNGRLPFRTYFQQLMERSIYARDMVFSFLGSIISLKYLLNVEGSIFSLMLFAGVLALLIRCCRYRELRDQLLLVFSAVPFLIFALFQYRGYFLSRTISVVVPFIPIIIATLFLGVKKKVFYYFVLIILFFLGFFRALPIVRATSGYRQASQYIQEKGYKKLFILDNEPVFRAYLGRVAYNPYQRPLGLNDLLRQSRDSGIDRLVVDFNTIYSKYGQDYVNEVVDKIKPEAVFQNPAAVSFVHLAELYPYNTIKEIMAGNRSGKIEIYNLSKF